jgi:hypothetical protein
MLKHFHLGRRANFPAIFLVAVTLMYGIGYALWGDAKGASIFQPKSAFELFVAVIGISAAFTHFLYKQHHQDTEIFVNLFEKFNLRYDDLNEMLNAIVTRPVGSPLSTQQIDTLYDYFNLCAEEYLFYEAGYIDEKVWQAWVCGMKYFAKDTAILRLWEKEIAAGSYYKFELSLLKN